MADRSDSDRLRGFDVRLIDRQMDGRTFAIRESPSRLKILSGGMLSTRTRVNLHALHNYFCSSDNFLEHSTADEGSQDLGLGWEATIYAGVINVGSSRALYGWIYAMNGLIHNLGPGHQRDQKLLTNNLAVL